MALTCSAHPDLSGPMTLTLPDNGGVDCSDGGDGAVVILLLQDTSWTNKIQQVDMLQSTYSQWMADMSQSTYSQWMVDMSQSTYSPWMVDMSLSTYSQWMADMPQSAYSQGKSDMSQSTVGEMMTCHNKKSG